MGRAIGQKNYSNRQGLIATADKNQVGIGGGTSLSYINKRDLSSQKFDSSWISVHLDGSPVTRKNRKYASLSAPGFRSYLVNRIMEQVQVGIIEIHLGESNGEIHFDDWTLGLKGDSGFIQWLKGKYADKSESWWVESFGELGHRIHSKLSVRRSDFLRLTENHKERFFLEFGKPGSWSGKNSVGEAAFLADLYTANMESFINELKGRLERSNFKNVSIDIWGFADWMLKMSVQPDAYLSTPPDVRWRLNWSTDANFRLEESRERIEKIMKQQVASVKPIPVIYMIDHPSPFDDFKKLSDDRQAQITQFFLEVTHKIGGKFVFRTYSNDRELLGPKTKQVILNGCH